MKYNITSAFLFIWSLLALLISCEDGLPKNPTVVSPISALVMTVSGIDYTAVPKLKASGELNDTLFLPVRIPAETAVVKALSLEKGSTTDVKEGDVVTFTKDVFPIVLFKEGDNHTYFVKMDYKEPAMLYFVKSSDRDGEGNRYYLDTEKAQRLASLNSDGKYEGFIDLSATNWDNICLVAPDLKSMYDYNGGWWPEQSGGTFTLIRKTTSGTSRYFPSDGPWADWLWTNDNPQIVSPGIWKFNFSISSGELNLVETQWAVSGAAAGKTLAMMYNPTGKEWALNANLSAGNLRFVTISVTPGDPAFSYGELGVADDTGYLESPGRDIRIKEAGTYAITVNLSRPPYYSYSIAKK